MTVQELERKTFYTNGIKENLEIYSLTNNTILSYEFKDTDTSGIEILYSCQKHTNNGGKTMEYGKWNKSEIILPNSEFQYSLKSDDTYLVDIELKTAFPTSGLKAKKR